MCPVARQCFLQGRSAERSKVLRHCDAHESGTDHPSTRQLDKPPNHQTFSSLLTSVSPHYPTQETLNSLNLFRKMTRLGELTECAAALSDQPSPRARPLYHVCLLQGALWLLYTMRNRHVTHFVECTLADTFLLCKPHCSNYCLTACTNINQVCRLKIGDCVSYTFSLLSSGQLTE